MISLLKFILSFFIVFSMVDLSAINLLNNVVCDQNTVSVSVSDIVEVQYEILNKTKNIVSVVCNGIANDVVYILTTKQQQKTIVDLDNCLFILKSEGCLGFTRYMLKIYSKYISMFSAYNNIMLFFFIFVFLFILRYLGLLFTFGKINKLYINMKAYSM